MTALLREPLLHFAVASLIVFAGHAVWSRYASSPEDTIVVTAAELERMAALYAAEAGSLPNAADMQAMVTDHVRDVALAREARRLGLHIGDTVVDRRLAQKMTFLVSDLAEITPPTEEELRAWHTRHAHRFQIPARFTFDHIYFSADRKRQPGAQAAAETLQRLTQDSSADWTALGDPFMLSRAYGELPLRETVRLFGEPFAGALSRLPANGKWSGPVQSAFGYHLVRLKQKADAQLPPFEDVRATVEKDWQDAQRRKDNAEAIARIVERYDVVIEGADDR